jgi:hypothetical protein
MLILDLLDLLCRLRHTYLRKNNEFVVTPIICSCRPVPVLLINNNFLGQHVCVLVDTCAENNVCSNA